MSRMGPSCDALDRPISSMIIQHASVSCLRKLMSGHYLRFYVANIEPLFFNFITKRVHSHGILTHITVAFLCRILERVPRAS